MKNLFLILQFLSFCLFAEPLDENRFERILNKNLLQPNGEISLPSNIDTGYLLVTGVAQEIIFDYYGTMKRTLKKNIWEKTGRTDRVEVIYQNSLDTIENKADNILTKAIEQIAKQGVGSKVVLFGHSMGALELWTLMMKYPDFVRTHVDSLIFLQAPFGGSPLAKFIADGKTASSLSSFCENPLFYSVISAMLKLYRPYTPGLEQITPKNATAHVQNTLEKYGKFHAADIQDKALYIGTHQEPIQGIRQFIPSPDALANLCGKALDKISISQGMKPGKSDRFVKLEDQFPSALASKKLVLPNFNHMSFPNTGKGKAMGKTLLEGLH